MKSVRTFVDKPVVLVASAIVIIAGVTAAATSAGAATATAAAGRVSVAPSSSVGNDLTPTSSPKVASSELSSRTAAEKGTGRWSGPQIWDLTPDAAQIVAKSLGRAPARVQVQFARLDAIVQSTGSITEADVDTTAQKLGVTPDQFGQALRTLKMYLASKVSNSNAGPDLLTQPGAAVVLARLLHVSEAAAAGALAELHAQVRGDGLDPKAPAFGAVAAGLGVSATQLADGIAQIKKSG